MLESQRLILKKENFKFSAAHFLIFDKLRAERLHGHNYLVRVELGLSDTDLISTRGFCIDFGTLKNFIKDQLDLWDERVLLPASHPEMKIEQKKKSCEVHFRDRFYVFPSDEVVLLPMVNTSVELLSRELAKIFFVEFQKMGVVSVCVTVEETQGQGASTTFVVS